MIGAFEVSLRWIKYSIHNPLTNLTSFLGMAKTSRFRDIDSVRVRDEPVLVGRGVPEARKLGQPPMRINHLAYLGLRELDSAIDDRRHSKRGVRVVHPL